MSERACESLTFLGGPERSWGGGWEALEKHWKCGANNHIIGSAKGPLSRDGRLGTRLAQPLLACWAAWDAIGGRHKRAGRLWTRLAAATGVLGGFGRDWQPPQACWTTLDTIGSRQRALGAARARGAPHSVAGSSGVLSAVWPGRRRDGRTRAASSVSLAKMNNPSNTFAMPVNVRS